MSKELLSPGVDTASRPSVGEADSRRIREDFLAHLQQVEQDEAVAGSRLAADFGLVKELIEWLKRIQNIRHTLMQSFEKIREGNSNRVLLERERINLSQNSDRVRELEQEVSALVSRGSRSGLDTETELVSRRVEEIQALKRSHEDALVYIDALITVL
ncbi:MAG: hypothetical protein WCW16_03450 [Candidatus Magasanikbacteria bacterium]